MHYMDRLANSTPTITKRSLYASVDSTTAAKRAAKTVLSDAERDYLDHHRATDREMRANRAVGF